MVLDVNSPEKYERDLLSFSSWRPHIRATSLKKWWISFLWRVNVRN